MKYEKLSDLPLALKMEWTTSEGLLGNLAIISTWVLAE